MEIEFLTLENVVSVQETIRKYSHEYTAKELWEKLPHRIKLKTFLSIIDYLHYTNKIMTDANDGTIFWSYNPQLLKKIEKEGYEIYED